MNTAATKAYKLALVLAIIAERCGPSPRTGVSSTTSSSLLMSIGSSMSMTSTRDAAGDTHVDALVWSTSAGADVGSASSGV